MCAVIGVFSKNIINTSFIKLLMQQSMIRGKHATGVSYLSASINEYIDNCALAFIIAFGCSLPVFNSNGNILINESISRLDFIPGCVACVNPCFFLQTRCGESFALQP